MGSVFPWMILKRLFLIEYAEGYSNDTIKRTQVFFQTNHGNTQRARDIVGGVFDLAKTLVFTVAEGIEEADEVVFLKEHGCDEIQAIIIPSHCV